MPSGLPGLAPLPPASGERERRRDDFVQIDPEDIPPAPFAEHLDDPEHPDLNRQAPESFRVEVVTTRGPFIIEVRRRWAPNGADRFYNLVNAGYYDGCRFFRVINLFIAQFGIHGDPAINEAWSGATIQDDKVREGNIRGMVSFAAPTQRLHARTTQLFINYQNNQFLDRYGFAPIGRVIKGMTIVDRIYSVYGDSEPRGHGPAQSRVYLEGNDYLDAEYPLLDYIIYARVVEPKPEAEPEHEDRADAEDNPQPAPSADSEPAVEVDAQQPTDTHSN